jgi:hypothetical protein
MKTTIFDEFSEELRDSYQKNPIFRVTVPPPCVSYITNEVSYDPVIRKKCNKMS